MKSRLYAFVPHTNTVCHSLPLTVPQANFVHRQINCFNTTCMPFAPRQHTQPSYRYSPSLDLPRARLYYHYVHVVRTITRHVPRTGIIFISQWYVDITFGCTMDLDSAASISALWLRHCCPVPSEWPGNVSVLMATSRPCMRATSVMS